MKGLIWFLGFAVVPIIFSEDQDQVSVKHLVLEGLNTLSHEVVVKASPQEIWDLFTTSEGMKSWIAPFAHIDFREGGLGETSYNPDAELGDEANIVFRYSNIHLLKSFDSELVRPPKDNPFGKVLVELKNRVILEDLGDGSVKVSILMMGWTDSEEHTSVKKFFEQGNAWYCKQLIKRFQDGPQPLPKND